MENAKHRGNINFSLFHLEEIGIFMVVSFLKRSIQPIEE